MHRTKKYAVGAAVLALGVMLAACGQVAGEPDGQSTPPAATPAPSESPTVEPTPSETPPPAETPAETPAPTPVPSEAPIDVVEHELPMIARSTADGVAVRTLPSLDAPLISGEAFDLTKVPNIRLAAGDLVYSTLGPVVVDGHSWYEVRAGDGWDVYWEGGWVSGQYLAREGDVPSADPVIVGIDGIGTGGTASADVMAGSPLTVHYAAAPVDGSDSCEIEVTLLRTDGLGVNVATETLTGARSVQFTPTEMPPLFQEETGTATLDVATDCTFAASIMIPPY